MFAKQIVPRLGVSVMLALWSSAALATSFDCNKANRPDEIAVCRDSGLSDMDETNADMFRRAAQIVHPLAHLVQSEFLKMRKVCGKNVGCIKDKYQKASKLYNKIIAGDYPGGPHYSEDAGKQKTSPGNDNALGPIQAFTGDWVSGEKCEDSETLSRLIITKDTFDGYEEHCKFISSRKLGEATVFKVSCIFGDERWNEEISLTAEGDSLSVKRSKGNSPTVYTRCLTTAELRARQAKAGEDQKRLQLKTAREHGFASYEEYQDYLDREKRLNQSGISLKPH